MNQEQLQQFAEQFFGECVSLMKKKNTDYTAKSEYAFANFTALAQVAGLPEATNIGFLNRMFDKFMRISSFVKNGKLEVSDESVKDTLRDLANYSMLFAAYLESQRTQQKTE